MSPVKKFSQYEIEGIDHRDAPDYVDAFICAATAELEDGTFREATEEEIEKLNDDGDLVYELVQDWIH